MGGCVDREAKFSMQRQQDEFYSELKHKNQEQEALEAYPCSRIGIKHDSKSTFINSDTSSRIANKRAASEIIIPYSNEHRLLDANSVRNNESVKEENSVNSRNEKIELEVEPAFTSEDGNSKNGEFSASDFSSHFQVQSFPCFFFKGSFLNENPPAKRYHISLDLKDLANTPKDETNPSEINEASSLESQRVLEISKNTIESGSQTGMRHLVAGIFSTQSLNEGFNPQRYSISDFNQRKSSPTISSGKPKFSSSKFSEIAKRSDKKVPRKIRIHKSQLKRKLKLIKCEEIEIFAAVTDSVKTFDTGTVTDLSAAELSSHDDSYAKILNSKRYSLDKTACPSPDVKLEHHQPDESLSFTPASKARAHLRVSTSVTYNKVIAPESPLLPASPTTCKLLERKSTIVHNAFRSQPYIRPCLGRSLTSIRE